MSKYLRFFESDCSFSYPRTYSGPKRGYTDSSNTQVAGYLDRLSETELLVTGMKIIMFKDAHWQIVFYLGNVTSNTWYYQISYISVDTR